ncbi:MAG: polysaccharide biosynthesis tyrosine autokinase [Acidobacteriia bacterium]|nr:polysaccharide biosynthesis tyrosine autokinase [Terriglobia bacterium]
MPQNHDPSRQLRKPLAVQGGSAYSSAHNLPASAPTVYYHRETEPENDTVGDYWQVLARRKGTLALIALIGAAAGLAVTRVETPSYRARTLIEIESLNNDFLNMRTVSPNAADEGTQQPPDYNIRTQALVLQSQPVAERVASVPGMEQRLIDSERPSPWVFWRHDPGAASQASPHDRATGIVSANLKARAEPNTRVIEATYESSNPKLAADVLNAAAAAFADLNQERRWQASQSTGQWLSRQLADVKSKLEHAEDSLQGYANDADLTILGGKDSTAEERLRQLQVELLRAQADRVVKQAAYEQAANASPETLPQVLDDTTLKAYQEQLTALRRDQARLNTQFTAESPKVKDVEAQITALESALQRKKNEIVARIRNEYSAAAQRENLLTSDYARQTKTVSQQASKVARYSNLKREVDSTSQLYESLIQRVKEAGLAAAMRASDVRVVEAAGAPRLPVSPNVWLNTSFGMVTGLCAGAFFLMRRARSYRGIQAPGEISVQLHVPELGVIPATAPRFAKIRKILGRQDTETPLELMTSQEEFSPIAGSFRFALASILLAESSGDAPRVIVVSSANAGEGKTTVISNLAIALAQVNRRVLLIDADWRKPRLHDIFEVENHVGLSEAVMHDPASAVRPTKVSNLSLIPSGKNTDERLFFNTQLQALIGRLRNDYDMILIDTPPLRMSEARMIGRQADAVILVVAQHTDREAVLLAQRRLQEDGSYLLGTILNNWDPKTSVHGDSEYGDYYKTRGYYGSAKAHA